MDLVFKRPPSILLMHLFLPLRSQARAWKKPTPMEKKTDPFERTEALDSLFEETKALFHHLALLAAEIHKDGELTAGKRGVLRSIIAGGAQTVPKLAATRGVTRQHVQGIVNQLIEEGRVEKIANPIHQKSSLIAPTNRGRTQLQEMLQREANVLAGMTIRASAAQIRQAKDTMQQLREDLCLG